MSPTCLSLSPIFLRSSNYSAQDANIRELLPPYSQLACLQHDSGPTFLVFLIQMLLVRPGTALHLAIGELMWLDHLARFPNNQHHMPGNLNLGFQ